MCQTKRRGQSPEKVVENFRRVDYNRLHEKEEKWVSSPQALVFCFYHCISVIGGGAPRADEDSTIEAPFRRNAGKGLFLWSFS